MESLDNGLTTEKVKKTYESKVSIPNSEILNEKLFEESFESLPKKEMSISDYTPYFKGHPYISGETWQTFSIIHSRIIKISKKIVTCECIIDFDNSIFELRDFDAELFEHLEKIKMFHPVIIKISSKPGSARIDIHDGRGQVDLSIFEIEANWNKLDDPKLNQPIVFDND